MDLTISLLTAGRGPRSKTLRQRRSLEPVLVNLLAHYHDRPRAGNRPDLHPLAASGQPPGLPVVDDGHLRVHRAASANCHPFLR